jgi:hypothetical protein
MVETPIVEISLALTLSLKCFSNAELGRVADDAKHIPAAIAASTNIDSSLLFSASVEALLRAL